MTVKEEYEPTWPTENDHCHEDQRGPAPEDSRRQPRTRGALPSEPELAREYNVSRQTARTALQALEREGLIVVRPRRGRIVRSSQRLRWHLSEFERPDHTMLTTSDAWETDIESQGHDPTRQDLQVEQITPPPASPTRLKLDPKTDVCVVRRHVRYIDDRPAIISDDYFDERIVRGTELAEPEDTTRENILAEAGYEQVYDIDEIITRMPTPKEIEQTQDRDGHASCRTHQDRLHGREPASPGDGVDRPRRHADPSVHRPDIARWQVRRLRRLVPTLGAVTIFYTASRARLRRARPSGPGRVRTRNARHIEGMREAARGTRRSRAGAQATRRLRAAACRALTGGSPPGAAPPPGQQARTRRQAVPATTHPDDRDREPTGPSSSRRAFSRRAKITGKVVRPRCAAGAPPCL